MEKYRKFTEEQMNYGSSEMNTDITRASGVRFSDGPHVPSANLSSNLTGDRYSPQNKLEVFRLQLLACTEHLVFRIITLVLIIVDLVVVALDMSVKGFNPTLEVIALILSSYFMLEILCRIFGKGIKKFMKSWIDVMDMLIVTTTFTCTVVYTVVQLEHIGYTKFIVAGRLVRIIMIVRFITERKHITKATRMIVSQNKRRYRMEGFDLDLCYITDNVIAMSFPSSGLMSFYRNPIKQVGKFLDQKHADHYKVYNLCSEKDYNESVFHQRVERFPIDDHNVPQLRDLVRFCDDVRRWLAADPQNVIAVHCKGGKGRTGTMLCTWLIDSGLFEQTQESLEYFGNRRTDYTVGSKFQGIETPSQSRYVGYYELLKKTDNGRQLPVDRQLKLSSLKITAIAGVGEGNGSDLSVEVICDNSKVMEANCGSLFNCKVKHIEEEDSVLVEFVQSPVLLHDVKVRVCSRSARVPVGYDKCAFYFWFHTSFVEDNKLVIGREALDNPHKEKTWSTFRENFSVQLNFIAASSINHH